MSMLVNPFVFSSAPGFAGPVALTVTNPGADTGDLTGWSTVSGSVPMISGNSFGSGFPNAADSGSRYFTSGTNSSTKIYQDIDVSAYATQIDAGLVKAVFAAKYCTFDYYSDYLSIFIRALDVSNAIISSESVPEYTTTGPTVWLPVDVGMLLPSGTRKIRIEMWGTRRSGSANDVFIDSTTLTLQDASYVLPTSYDKAISSGNRSSLITVSATNISAGGGTPAGLVDGSDANNYWWTSASGNGTGFIKFQFTTAQVIDEFVLRQDTNDSHGVWRIEGSNDDSTWTQVGSDITLVAGPNKFGNPSKVSYLYYRMRHMSGTRSSGPYLREILFRAD